MSALVDLDSLTMLSVCFRVVFHAKAKRFDNLLKCGILLKLKDKVKGASRNFEKRVRKRAIKQ